MADLSKIRKNGVDYDIKDSVARAAIEELQNGDNIDLSGYVQSVNGVAPDENGNVDVAGGSGCDVSVEGEKLFLSDGGNDGVYELIDTINVSEAIEKIAITTEPSGKPYNLTRLIVRAKLTPTSTNEVLNVWVNDKTQAVTLQNAATTEGTRYSSAVLWVENGFIRCEGNTGTHGEYNIPQKVGASYARVLAKGDKIYNIDFLMTNNQSFQPGSSFEIWGVRA